MLAQRSIAGGTAAVMLWGLAAECKPGVLALPMAVLPWARAYEAVNL